MLRNGTINSPPLFAFLLYLLVCGLGVHLELPLEEVHRGEAGGVLLGDQAQVVRVRGAVVEHALVARNGQLGEPHLSRGLLIK